MARDEPELFEKSCHLEETLILRRGTLPCPGAGRHPMEAIRRDDDGDYGAEDEDRFEYIGYTSPDGMGACPSCRSRQPINDDMPDGRVRMVDHARGPVYLTRFGKPLRSIFGAESGGGIQGSLLAPGWDEDEGYRCGDVCDT